MKRTMTIRVERDEGRARKRVREGFVRAWKSKRYQGEEFSFESAEALFRAITPARWTVLARLQRTGPSALRALARDLGRDVKAVHRDVQALSVLGLVQKDENGRIRVPFARIRTEFEIADAA